MSSFLRQGVEKATLYPPLALPAGGGSCLPNPFFAPGSGLVNVLTQASPAMVSYSASAGFFNDSFTRRTPSEVTTRPPVGFLAPLPQPFIPRALGRPRVNLTLNNTKTFTAPPTRTAPAVVSPTEAGKAVDALYSRQGAQPSPSCATAIPPAPPRHAFAHPG
jgi:hypothetical protein